MASSSCRFLLRDNANAVGPVPIEPRSIQIPLTVLLPVLQRRTRGQGNNSVAVVGELEACTPGRCKTWSRRGTIWSLLTCLLE
jgi:hypothetical protein